MNRTDIQLTCDHPAADSTCPTVTAPTGRAARAEALATGWHLRHTTQEPTR